MKLPLFQAFVAPLALLSASAFAQSVPSPSSDADARALEIGRAYIRYQDQLRHLSSATSDSLAWWRIPAGTYTSAATREKFAQAQHDFVEAIRVPLGTEPILSTGRDSRYSFLPESKQGAAAQIDQSYSEKLAELRRETQNLRLPADAEKTKQLNAAREHDLLAILTPAEFELLEMRTSTASSTIRQRFGEVIESEEEFRKIFVLQKAFEEKFPIEDAIYSIRSQEAMRQRSEAERKVMDDIRGVVGDERFVLFRRAIDQDYQALRAIVRRLNRPESTLEAAMKVRDSYAMQSMTINAETSLNSMDRRALIQDLAKEARKELLALLTPPGVEAYASRTQWLRYLEQGTAFSTNPKDSSSGYASIMQSTFLVLPSGATITSASGTITTGTPVPPASAPGSTVRRTRPATPVQGSAEPKPAAEKPASDTAPPSTPKP